MFNNPSSKVGTRTTTKAIVIEPAIVVAVVVVVAEVVVVVAEAVIARGADGFARH